MRISDWSSDVCSSDLDVRLDLSGLEAGGQLIQIACLDVHEQEACSYVPPLCCLRWGRWDRSDQRAARFDTGEQLRPRRASDEIDGRVGFTLITSELRRQSDLVGSKSAEVFQLSLSPRSNDLNAGGERQHDSVASKIGRAWCRERVCKYV